MAPSENGRTSPLPEPLRDSTCSLREGQGPQPSCDLIQHRHDTVHFSVQFSRSVVSDSLRPHEPQHARPPCPSPTSNQLEGPLLIRRKWDMTRETQVSPAWLHMLLNRQVLIPEQLFQPVSPCSQRAHTDSHWPTSQFGILAKDWTRAYPCAILGS